MAKKCTKKRDARAARTERPQSGLIKNSINRYCTKTNQLDQMNLADAMYSWNPCHCTLRNSAVH